MSHRIKTPEILAPVGHADAFYAAIEAGCDAVYLGGLHFGARDYANNFDHEQLIELVKYAHLRNVRVYYTLNTLVKDIEFKQLHLELEFLNTLSLDALIIQDLGVFEYIRRFFPTFILHGSTQLNIHNVKDAQFFYDLGFEKIVLARECSLNDIETIIANVPIEVETFVHGALCYSYSGQCLMSSFYGGRSGNRGKCAGPCRLPFSINQDEGYYLSMKDQMTLAILPQLILAGIDSFKIEGRMKNAEYVFFATSLYKKYRKKAIECIKQDRLQEYKLDQTDIDLLKVIYNRGDFTEGYYYAQRKSPVSLEHPKHLGLYVGSAKVIGQSISLKLNKPLAKGDVVEWHIPSLRFTDTSYPTLTIDKDWSKKSITLSPSLPIVKKIVSWQESHASDIKLYKIFDPKIQKNIEQLTNEYQTIVDVSVLAEVGKPLRLDLDYQEDGEKHHFKVEGFCVDEAQNRPIDASLLKKQLNKTEDSVFTFRFNEITILGNAFIPLGAINQVRRDALVQLENNKLEILYKKRQAFQLKQLMAQRIQPHQKNIAPISNKGLRISISSVQQWEALKESYKAYGINALVDCIYIEWMDLSQEQRIKIFSEKESFEKDTKYYLALPQVVFPSFHKKFIEEITDIDMSMVDGFLIRSLGQIDMIKHYNKPITSDYNLHVFNQWSENFLHQYIDTVTLSVELNARGMQDIIKSVQAQKIEWVAYGHIRLMQSSTCVYKTYHGRCDYAHEGHWLQIKDRKQEVQMVKSHCSMCYNSIYNAKASNITEYVEQMGGKFRVEFTHESKDEVYALMKQLYQKHGITFDEGFMTKGHIQRGVK